VSENTEIRIIGTEVQENNALVYADTKLQTLDRRVGKDNLYFDKEMFAQSLKDWENTPIIYQKDGIHPDDFQAVLTDPKKAAEDIGGKLVGRVHDPRIVLEGGARLMATLSINDDEEEIAKLWQTGKLFPSTAFTTHSDGDKIITPPVPNHVLLFPMQKDKVLPGDPGAFVNTKRVIEMESKKTEETNTVSSEIVEKKDKEIQQLNAELVELKHALEEFATIKAELEQYKQREKEEKFSRLINALPIGMTQTEDQRMHLKDMLENHPEDLLFTVIDSMKKEDATTKRTGTPYVFSENRTPFTTVGNMNGSA